MSKQETPKTPTPAPAAAAPVAPPAKVETEIAPTPAPAAAAPVAPPAKAPAAAAPKFPTYVNRHNGRLDIRGFVIEKGGKRTVSADEAQNENIMSRLAHAERNGLIEKV